ncbi:acyl-CoA dehydrogenase [Oxalobacteraceae bacterium GrIS 1.11]
MQIFDPVILDLPFFDDRHRVLAKKLEQWAGENLAMQEEDTTLCARERGRRYTRLLAQAGWFAGLVESTSNGRPDLRSICLMREAFAFMDDLLDFAFSIQALSVSVINWYGNASQKGQYLDAALRGELIGALALSEPSAGSDLASVACEAKVTSSGFEIDGDKCWVSNGDIADFCCLLARTGDGPGALGLGMFVVPMPGHDTITVTPIDLIAPRAFSNLSFKQCTLGHDALLGETGSGFRYAMEVLNFYRVSVGGAAIGFSRRARQAALQWSNGRLIAGGGTLLRTQVTQAKFADIDVQLHASALLVARAAWEFDSGKRGGSARHAAMAKLSATEAAQHIVDEAVQLLGAAGLIEQSITAKLYRQIRSLRIYEGTSEIQKMIIAGGMKIE